MTCPKCESEKFVEIPHPIHGAAIRCEECGRFIKWKGKSQSPKEYFAGMLKVAGVRQPGFALAKFHEKFGRWPTKEEEE